MKIKDANGFQVNIGDEVVFLGLRYHALYPNSYYDWDVESHNITFEVKDIVISNGHFCFVDSNNQAYIANCCILKKTSDFIEKVLDIHDKFMV